MQKSFWDVLESKTTKTKTLNSKELYKLQLELSTTFENWLVDIDKCWQRHAHETPSDVEALYKKLLRSSRLFLYTSLPFVPMHWDKTDDATLNNNIIPNLSKYIEIITDLSKHTTHDSGKKISDFPIEAFLKLPVDSWLHHSVFSAPPDKRDQHQTKNSSNDPEFAVALNNYFRALNDYRQLYVQLFISTAGTFLETLKKEDEPQASKLHIMASWPELVESNYSELISRPEYSQTYANVINNWMLILSLSNLSFSDRNQSVSSVHND